MKKIGLILILITISFIACNHEDEKNSSNRQKESTKNEEAHDHEHDEGCMVVGDAQSHESEEVITDYLISENFELFVKYEPLIKNQSKHLLIYLTDIKNYKPIEHVHLHAHFTLNNKTYELDHSTMIADGIFEIEVETKESGKANFEIEIDVHSVTEVFSFTANINENEEEAEKELLKFEAQLSDKIHFKKQQVWNTDFKTNLVSYNLISDVIKATGQLIAAPGDETIITAEANGIVQFNGYKCLVGQRISKADEVMKIIASGIDNNINSKYSQAKAEYDKDKANYERAKVLLEKGFISKQEYDLINTEYVTAKTNFETIAKNFSQSGQVVKSSIDGYIKNILVHNGEYVEAGKPLFEISKNQKVIVFAEISQKHINKLNLIKHAAFRASGSEKYYNTKTLNGRLISQGKSILPNSPLIPVYFEIENKTDILPGAFLEVNLLSDAKNKVLSIPYTALIEEFGIFSVYIQYNGDHYEKRNVKLGRFDGINYEVLSGLKEGERLVTEGAFQIKIASQSGSIPGHSH